MTPRSGLSTPPPNAPRARATAVLLALCIVLISAVDAALLELGQTFFTAGFNAVYLDGAGPLLGFAASSLLVDFCLVIGVWALLVPLLSPWGGTSLQKLAVVALASLALPFSIDFVRYQIGLVLGRVVSFPVIWEVSGGGVQVMLAEAAEHAVPLLFTLCAAGVVAAGAIWWLGRIGQHHPQAAWADAVALPSARRLAALFAALALVSTLVLIGAASGAPRIYAGLAAKPSAWIGIRIIQFVTDVDRDGFGLLSRPADPAPFDGDRNPYARDIAGNGIDENGLAGDLPAGTRPVEGLAAEGVDPAHTRRPDFLLVYLESFRADRLGGERNGREITPFLNALARQGTSSDHAYVNSPYTIGSRSQLFAGSLIPRAGEPTLIDDFNGLGYTVAYFSGQDDSFGHSEALIGTGRADHFYDARQDIERRTSRSTTAGSLQISAKLLTQRVGGYLSGFDPKSGKPLFLYVNLVDTHFPYTHDELDDLLGVSPLSRYEIQVSRAEAVRATYDNTTANVDLAIRRVVEAFRKAVGHRDHAILVASDHGQALFEGGHLGHGQALTDDQTRTPFVLYGVGGEWPEPLGMADVRGLLQRNLFAPRASATPRARFVPDPERRIFHLVGRIHRPHIIGLRTPRGLTSFDLRRSAFDVFDAKGARLQPDPQAEARAFDELIWTWEATRSAVLPDDEEATRRDPGPA